MAVLLFVDESGHDRKKSPYEVLAGVAVEDRDLWNLIRALQDAELRHFGRRYSAGRNELKGSRLLDRRTFQQASLNAPYPRAERARLAAEILDAGQGKSAVWIKALAEAKLAYVQEAFEICSRFRCRVFANIVDVDAPGTATSGLRKDYAYLFQRFFYYLEDMAPSQMGIIVFDELERSASHILIEQCAHYFDDTATGKSRARLIVPEPFFVHSELTTGIQLADLAAYVISWGLRFGPLTKPARPELAPFAEQVRTLRHRTVREVDGAAGFAIWSLAFIADLRTQSERTP